MGIIDVRWVMDFESRMRLIQHNTYMALAAAPNQWWGEITKVSTTLSFREIMAWILSTARIEDAGEKGGDFHFQDMAMLETDFRVRFATAGLELFKSELEDQDSNGLQAATSWVSQVTSMAAYWPQTKVTDLMKNGESRNGYDDVAFFHAAHPNNPHNLSAGNYGNIISSVPIDESVSVDVALNNLNKVRAHIAGIKQPNGVDPRFLKPAGIICNSKLTPRATMLTSAKQIAMTAGLTSAVGGSGDVTGYIQSLGYGKVIEAPEFNGWESDTSYFVIAKQEGVPDDELSGFVYLDREPFDVRYYTGSGGGAPTGLDAILNLLNKLQWHIQGRNVAGFGHPFRIFKCKPGA